MKRKRPLIRVLADCISEVSIRSKRNRTMNVWYSTLSRPPLTPPDWIFAPVWSVLYVTITVSIVLYYRSPAKSQVWLTTGILVFHLIANFIWTALFFRLQSPALALADILFMDISLVVIIISFWSSSRAAAVLLIPYLIWILFATYLNFGFFILN